MENHKIILPKFKLDRTLKDHFTYTSLLAAIVDELKKIPKLDELKGNIELTKMICVVVEQIVSAKSNKIKFQIDKKTLVLNILVEIHNLNETEQLNVSKTIDFMCENGLIKIPSLFLKFLKFFF